jgi:uncharacterized membrane protein
MAEENNDKMQEVPTNRVEAFSDGVFAIAITLLILQIKLPAGKIFGDTSLRSHLLKLWPEYFTYCFSFLTIGIYWANHHYIFKFYARTDHTFLVLNLFFLMSVSFLPFPTAVLGEYITDLSHKETAVTFYALGIYLPAFFWCMIWLYASYKGRLIDNKLDKNFVRYLTWLYLISNALYLSSIIISLFSPIASVVITVVLTLLFMLPPKNPRYQDA